MQDHVEDLEDEGEHGGTPMIAPRGKGGTRGLSGPED